MPGKKQVFPGSKKVLSIITIQKSANCQEALELMFTNKIHHLIVMDGKTLFGTVSDRDLFYRWFNQAKETNLSLKELPVSSATRTDCPTVTPTTSLFQIADWMRGHRVSVLPFRTTDGSLKAITETDLLNILWGIVRHENFFERVLMAAETSLASPPAQKIIEMISQMGI